MAVTYLATVREGACPLVLHVAGVCVGCATFGLYLRRPSSSPRLSVGIADSMTITQGDSRAGTQNDRLDKSVPTVWGTGPGQVYARVCTHVYAHVCTHMLIVAQMLSVASSFFMLGLKTAKLLLLKALWESRPNVRRDG